MASALRYLDLVLLAVALPVFIAADLPISGYLVVAGVWLALYGIEIGADRAIAGAVARRDRRAAMGWLGATGLARAWIVALAVLIVGLGRGQGRRPRRRGPLPDPLHRPPRQPHPGSGCWHSGEPE